MSNERKPGYYWAKISEDSRTEICSFEGGAFFFTENENAYFESELHFVSDQSVDDVILELKHKADELEELLKCEVEKTNTTTSRLLKLKANIKDLTIDEIGREIGEVIMETFKTDSITKP